MIPNSLRRAWSSDSASWESRLAASEGKSKVIWTGCHGSAGLFSENEINEMIKNWSDDRIQETRGPET